ncbi:hypothetical protein NITLEN_40320 [Nitrospira lenta]|uniref:Uncharacterized protein n=1 Tax=Nitrospira lenta TaxID=1436998 RepID=A0A330L7F8_9BACT|nr:hypothetical protein NITLEN_40320 [Nitrospira lenta]
MGDKIFQPKDGFDRQPIQVLKQREGSRRHLAECGAVVGAGEALCDGPFEQRHPLLGGHGLQQGQHALFLHRLNDDQWVTGADQGAEVMDAGCQGHTSAMLACEVRVTKRTDICYLDSGAVLDTDFAQRKPMVAERCAGGEPLRVAVRSMMILLFHDPPRTLR